MYKSVKWEKNIFGEKLDMNFINKKIGQNFGWLNFLIRKKNFYFGKNFVTRLWVKTGLLFHRFASHVYFLNLFEIENKPIRLNQKSTHKLMTNFSIWKKDFRDTVKKQIQRDLHIDSEAELFAAYIITGLQLFKLNSY